MPLTNLYEMDSSCQPRDIKSNTADVTDKNGRNFALVKCRPRIVKMQKFVNGSCRFYMYGILVSISVLGLVSRVHSVPVRMDSRTSDDTSQADESSKVEEAMSTWFREQIGWDELLNKTGNESKVNKQMGYFKEVFEALQGNNNSIKKGTSSQQVPLVRMKEGLTVGGKKGTSRTRVLFEMVRNRARVFSMIEIVLKYSRNADRGVERRGRIEAVISSNNKGRSKIQAQRFKDYLIFDVSNMVNLTTQLVRLLYVTIGTTRISVSQSNEPLIALYEHITENPLLRPGTRSEREVNFPYPTDGINPRDASWPGREYYCGRKNWILNMSILNYDWLLYPTSFNIGKCSGLCPTPIASDYFNATNYSFIKQVYHQMTMGAKRDVVPAACCTPLAYEPQIVHYINAHYEDVLASFPNMKVVYCGCR